MMKKDKNDIDFKIWEIEWIAGLKRLWRKIYDSVLIPKASIVARKPPVDKQNPRKKRPLKAPPFIFADLSQTHLSDWIQANQQLQSASQQLQAKINLIEVHRLNFKVLGLSNYLLRIQLSLATHQKYYEIYEGKQKDFTDIEKESHLEFLDVTTQCREIYQTVKACIHLIETADLKQMDVQAISMFMQLLEKQTQSLGDSISHLNHSTLKTGSLYHLLEADVFKVLTQGEYTQKQIKPHSNLHFREASAQMSFLLKKEALPLKEGQLKAIAQMLIVEYEALSKYLIFTNSEKLNNSFSDFFDSIRAFIRESIRLETDFILNHKDIESLYFILNSIFRHIESIRFVANKKDSFTKGLQESARLSAKTLRKNLHKTWIGEEFLNLHYRLDRKQKLELRSRFKS